MNLSGSGATALPVAPAMWVVEEPGRPGTIDVATYYGVWRCTTCRGRLRSRAGSDSAARTWQRGPSPKVEVDSLSLTSDNRTLFAWTHGRGVWKLALSG